MAHSPVLSDYGEKRIIKEIIAPICGEFDAGIGIGDDAALIDIPPGTSILVSTDKIPEDLIAMQLKLLSPFDHGRYLAQVNISDIAAMGGIPIGLVATFALPNDFSIDYLKLFLEGLTVGCSEHGIQVLGGDLGWGSAPCFSATALGYVEKKNVLRRNKASAGDAVFVSGEVGGFGSALAYFATAKKKGLSLSESDEKYFLEKLTRPQARVSLGKLLGESGVCSSCMDITDGVGQSIRELSEASNLNFEISSHLLPVHPATKIISEFLGVDDAQVIFGIGLDLQLIGTIKGSAKNLPSELKNQIQIIGIVREEGENSLCLEDGEIVPIPHLGWQHFLTDAMSQIKSLYT